MHEAADRFIERMGFWMEHEGMPRIAGRILGFLMLEEGAFSLDELAETLQVSKASVSTNARMLEQNGLVERAAAPGDRRDFYRLGHDPWDRMLQVGTRKWEAARAMFTESEAALPEEMEVGRRRLVEAEQFHLLLVDEAERLLERWRKRPREEELESNTQHGPGSALEAT